MLEMAIFVLRAAGLACSVVGYVLWVRSRLGMHEKFSWVFVLCSIACLVYFGGLLNILDYAVYALFIAGLVLFVYYALKKKLNLLFGLRSLTILNSAFAIGFSVIAYMLGTTKFIHYDNFSHWGLVVKYMLLHGGFPTAASAIIDFKTYPLGSSSFLYYVCRVVGGTEGAMLVAQAMLLFAGFYAMFGIIKDAKRMLLTSFLGLCFATMTFFNISIRINNLLVDFLLPVLALAAVAIVFTYRFEFTKACITVLPVLALLVIVKNSGLFFAAMCYAYLLYVAARKKKYHGRNRALMLLLAAVTIAATLATFAAWSLHTAREFEGQTSKHTMSTENFEDVYSGKTAEERQTIVANFEAAVFTIDSLATKGIVIFNALAVVAALTARLGFKKKWKLPVVLLVMDLAVAVYYIGILAMFLLTMPTAEALVLAGFERYASSAVVFFIGVLAICTCHDIEGSFYVQQGQKRNYMAFKSLLSKNIYQFFTTGFTALAVILLLSEANGMDSMKAGYSMSLPGRIEMMVKNNWQADNEARYLFYATDDDRQISDYYVQYVAKYMLFSPNVDATSTVGDDLEERMRQYDYLVVLESDAAIEEFMELHTTAGGHAGIFKVSEILPAG